MQQARSKSGIQIAALGRQWVRCAHKQASEGSQEPFKGATHTEHGTGFFRTFNFELYTKPEGRNKVLAYIGSTAFLGIMAYYTFGFAADEPST